MFSLGKLCYLASVSIVNSHFVFGRVFSSTLQVARNSEVLPVSTSSESIDFSAMCSDPGWPVKPVRNPF
ncbi:hypothetical protein JTE90_007730 [Oedothorax gibbosus]|uniref:Secreted protein n=1 Tax=Oedothorax gibbosus TaxID=931172 RepID=A0AAV6V7M0_9ARAC|nr:hypothetical protein JTE90_007730 [Oedothorax gibbosus]